MVEFYTSIIKEDVETLEDEIWQKVKHRFADNTLRWANVLKKPEEENYFIILPEDWGKIVEEKEIIVIKVLPLEVLKADGWFSTELEEVKIISKL